MGQLVKLYKESHLGKRLPAYDGRKSLYTAGPLPFSNKEFKITLVDEEDGSSGTKYDLLLSSYWGIYLCGTYWVNCLNLNMMQKRKGIQGCHQVRGSC